MKRWMIAVLLGISVFVGKEASAQSDYDAGWIWAESGERSADAPAEKFWFRREVRSTQPSTGVIRVLCDDHFTLWVNGRKIGEGGGEQLYRFNLNTIVGRGLNVIAVEATNSEGQAGLFVDGEVRGQGGTQYSFDTGAKWRVSRTAPEGDAWRLPRFDDSAWEAVKVIGPHADSPWKSIVLKDTHLDRFQVAPGFEIKRIAEPKLVGTLISMTGGNRGRLMACREKGPILSVIDDDGDGVFDRVVEYSTAVQNCQGLCMVFDDLYAVGKGPEGTGLYRLPDHNHDDVADSVEQVLKYKGNMGDHGPHAVVFGPDGWLYNNMGNGAYVTAKPESTSPIRDYYEGHLLKPRFEDANGHASGVKAPAGTIWRFTPDGKHWSCEVAGFRNEYDFAFSPQGDMFTYDSDMEWDVGMPWYRPVRVNHCVPGAEFGWRSGCAKWPAYRFDSLPAVVDTGRGSPTGVIFYDHRQFPEKYRGSFLICDWSVGRILSVHLAADGATFSGRAENLVTGNPLNASDIEVDRDGSLLFATGGRGTEGGIYRVSYPAGSASAAKVDSFDDVLDLPQLQSSWARELVIAAKQQAGTAWEAGLVEAARSGTPAHQIRALTLLSQFGPKPSAGLLIELMRDDDASVRAFATLLVGEHATTGINAALTRALSDAHPMVQRRACEAFVRSGIEPPVAPLVALMGTDDRWLRFAARLALERVSADEWFDTLLASRNVHVVTGGLLALHRLHIGNRLAADVAFSHDDALGLEAALINGSHGELSAEQTLEVLRMIELSLDAGARGPVVGTIAHKLLAMFPSGNRAIDAESARILAALQLPEAVEPIMVALERTDSESEQIDYALTLRYFQVGWSYDLKRRLLDWYEGTQLWEGGHSFTPYLANIVGATLEHFRPEERQLLLSDWKSRPFATGLLIEKTPAENLRDYELIVGSLLGDTSSSIDAGQRDKLLASVIDALADNGAPPARKLLRTIYDESPDQRDRLARALAAHPTEADWPYLTKALLTGETTTLQLCIRGLKEIAPKGSKPEDVRAVILAGLQLGPKTGANAVELLADMTNSPHDAGEDVTAAVAYYQKWYHTNYPDAPLAELPQENREKSKYTYEKLIGYLNGGAAQEKANVDRGRAIFTKAKCNRCHRFLKEGETVGPDLTTLRRRFQRKEIVESLVFPSRIISDQYQMLTVATTDGLIHNGMPIPGNDSSGNLVLLLPDATKLEIAKSKIDEQVRSRTSVMPVGILNDLSLEEIADLFAFLETSKYNQAAPKSSATADAAAGSGE
jgi:putative membrane-bound dehydrogenase-like protein